MDKWLWYARFFKTRGLSAKLVTAGKVRINGTPVSKPSRTVVVGDVLTFPKETDVRVIEIIAIGERRGPAPEAQTLYKDLAPPEPRSRDDGPYVQRSPAPDRRERRAAIRLKENQGE